MLALAVVLGLVFGQHHWQDIHWSGEALLTAIAATLPLAASLLWLPFGDWRWAKELTSLVQRFLTVLFRNARPGAVVLISLLAGLGEEMLFRGVAQAGLGELFTPAIGLVAAAVLFGAAHAVSPAYFVIASLMGLYLGALYLWTGNLLVPIAVHALYDWIAIRFYLRR